MNDNKNNKYRSFGNAYSNFHPPGTYVAQPGKASSSIINNESISRIGGYVALPKKETHSFAEMKFIKGMYGKCNLNLRVKRA